MAGLTGGAGTISFASTAITADIVEIGELTETGVAVDDTDLASTFNETIVGDLITYEPFSVTLVYDDTTKGDWDTHAVHTATGQIVVTFPGSDTYTYTTGFVLSRTMSAMQNNTRVLATYTIQPTAAPAFAAVP